MKWMGLTGGIATGKSTVAELLRRRSVPVVDADALVHEIMRAGSSAFNSITQTFGAQYVGPDGEIDRRALGQAVFGDSQKLAQLEGILHPLVRQRCLQERQRLNVAGHAVAVYDVPLLFEKQMQDQFDGIICVTSTHDLQRQRLKQRNKFSDSEIEQRLKHQLPLNVKEAGSDWVLHNNGSLPDLEKQVDDLVSQFAAVTTPKRTQ